MKKTEGWIWFGFQGVSFPCCVLLVSLGSSICDVVAFSMCDFSNGDLVCFSISGFSICHLVSSSISGFSISDLVDAMVGFPCR